MNKVVALCVLSMVCTIGLVSAFGGGMRGYGYSGYGGGGYQAIPMPYYVGGGGGGGFSDGGFIWILLLFSLLGNRKLGGCNICNGNGGGAGGDGGQGDGGAGGDNLK